MMTAQAAKGVASNIVIAVHISSWPAMCIHGDKAQQERDWVLSGTYEPFLNVTIPGSFFLKLCT